jgi:hypothetical protein
MSEFKLWEDMSGLEQAQCTYWDMYKDAHGVRPRGIDTSNWTLEDFDKEFLYLGKLIEREEDARHEAELVASKDFEVRIGELIALGAMDRKTALNWIMDADEAHGDWEYLCYINGLPYGYFKEA